MLIWLAGTAVVVSGVIGVVLTAVTLPGTWLMLLAALVCKLLVPEVLGWWWLTAAAGLALLGEIVEFLASAAGARAGGAGRAGTWGALLGGLVGAVLGTVFIPVPVLGTILGGVAGSGCLAAVLERRAGKGWGASSKAGAGAAAGRLLSTLLKAGVAGVMALVLTTGVVIALSTPGGSRAQAGSDMLPAEAGPGLAREDPAPAEPAGQLPERDGPQHEADAAAAR